MGETYLKKNQKVKLSDEQPCDLVGNLNSYQRLQRNVAGETDFADDISEWTVKDWQCKRSELENRERERELETETKEKTKCERGCKVETMKESETQRQTEKDRERERLETEM